MPSSERDRRLRAELAARLGYYPASLAPEDLERYRQMKADADDGSSRERVVREYAHLGEDRRRREAERAQRAAVSDLYE